MEFIKIAKDRYLIKNSRSVIVNEKEKLKLEKKEMIIEDITSNSCQQETTKKIKKINKKIEEKPVEVVEDETIEETEQVD